MFKRICLLMTFVLVLPLSACAAGSACEEGYQGIITFAGELHYQIHGQVGGSVLRKGSPYSGDVIPLKDGKLLLVASLWRTKGRDFGDAAYGITSDDMGKTWSRPFLLKLKGVRGVIEVKHTNSKHMTLLRLKSGALGLFSGNIFYRSEDEGKTWSKRVSDKISLTAEKLESEGWENWGWSEHARNASVTVLKSGRIVAPMYMCPSGQGYRGTEFIEDFCFGLGQYSDDEGKTWHISETMLVIPFDGGRKGFQYWDEWSLVELKDGRLLAFTRTIIGRLFQAYSDDQGKTWHGVQPTQLAASSAPCIVKRIPTTGDLLIIWSQHSGEEAKKMLIRHRLSCAISEDEGKTWQHFKNLESLDDVTKIEPPEIRIYSESERITQDYHQPADRKRYHRAPGPLRVAYPTVCFLDDKAIITYGYGCNDDTVGYVACKIRVLPIEWFYK